MADADAVSVRVVARFRPYNEKELALNMATTTYKFIGDECVNVNVRNMSSNIENILCFLAACSYEIYSIF